MPAKKTDDEATEAPAKTRKAASPAPGTTRTGVDIIEADREVLNGDIDERMDALLKDHQRMGARPK